MYFVGASEGYPGPASVYGFCRFAGGKSFWGIGKETFNFPEFKFLVEFYISILSEAHS